MWVLIVANLVAFFYQFTLPSPALERLVHLWGVVPAEFTDASLRSRAAPRQYMALVSSMFLHGGILHVLLNLWSLWIFGDNVEDHMGRGKFLLFYLVCGVAASAVHILMHPESTLPAIGASGAISGVMGAYVLLFPMARVLVVIPIIIIPLFLSVPALVFIGFWFAIQFLSGTAALSQQADAAGVAFWAHIGGFLSGMVLCPFLATRPASRG